MKHPFNLISQLYRIASLGSVFILTHFIILFISSIELYPNAFAKVYPSDTLAFQKVNDTYGDNRHFKTASKVYPLMRF